MHGTNRSISGKIAAGLLALLLLFAVLFSVFYISAEAHHDCEGENCPICVMLEQCENTLHQVSGGTVAILSVILPAVYFLLATSLFVCETSEKTLVANKVRLDN